MTLYLLLFFIKVAFSYVSVLGPEELQLQFKGNLYLTIDAFINASISNFGKIPYGFNLVFH